MGGFLAGYGSQTATFTPRLASLGHDMAIVAFAGIHQANADWEGIPVWPGGEQLGMELIRYHYGRHKADALIILSDAWANNAAICADMRTVCWMPVDQSPLSVLNSRFLKESKAIPLAMSRFGQHMLAGAGFKASYVPHGVDTGVFCPQDYTAAREAAGLGPGTFVIGISAANKDEYRKGLAEQMAAFALFRERHPDCRLLIHSMQRSEHGCNLPAIASRLGIGRAVIFSDQAKLAAGEIKPQNLAREFYALLDVLSAAAYAEGFGIPIVEAQACGVPVVATRGSAMLETAAPGWLAEGEPFWVAGHEAWWERPSIRSITDCYEQAWQAREDGAMDGRRTAAREHAMTYDADLVLAEYWKPFLDDLEANGRPLAAGAPKPKRKKGR